MPIIQKCTGCGARLKAPDSAAGRISKCPRCGDSLRIRSDVVLEPELGRDNSTTPVPTPTPQPRQSAALAPRYQVDGIQGQLQVFDDYLTITPRGVLGFLNHGLKGTKSLRFTAITGIQYRRAGGFVNGYLQFTIAGGNESKGGVLAATSDENSFMFARKVNELMDEVNEYIETQLRQAAASNSPTGPASLGDQLTKLAQLREDGLLTDDEFLHAKAKLLDA